MRTVFLALATVCASGVCVPIPALEQERASIVGVQDSTGAVMPELRSGRQPDGDGPVGRTDVGRDDARVLRDHRVARSTVTRSRR